MNKDIKYLVFGVCLAFVLLGAFGGVSVASATTIYVPDDYAKIQDAVNAASIGDTIIVRDGTYYENLKVNKQLTIKSKNGSANCIVDGGGSGDVITLNADGITIDRKVRCRNEIHNVSRISVSRELVSFSRSFSWCTI